LMSLDAGTLRGMRTFSIRSGFSMWAALLPFDLQALILVSVVTGIACAHACGTAWRWPEAIATGVLALLVGTAVHGNRRTHEGAIRSALPEPPSLAVTPDVMRDAAQQVAIIAIGVWVLLSARSGPGLLLIGLTELALIGAYMQFGRSWRPLSLGVVAVGTWLLVLGADYVQRGAFSAMAALAGVSMGLMAGVVFRRSKTSVWVDLMLVLAAHAWVAGWWWALWLPTQAWWALGSLPLSLVSTVLRRGSVRRPRRVRAVRALALAAAVTHGALLTAAYAWVSLIR